MSARSILLAATLVFSHGSWADTLVKGSFLGQPQIMLKDGSTNACGVRIVGGNEIFKADDILNGFDLSFMVYENQIALFKGLASKPVTGQALIDRKAIDENVRLKSFWVKAHGHPASKPINGKVSPGETKNSLLYLADASSTVKLLAAILDGQEIRIGIHRAAAPVGEVFYGVVPLSDGDIAQIRQCFGELAQVATR